MSDEINFARTFRCEKCEHTTLEEVMTNVVVLSTVTHVCEEGYVDYGEQMNEDGSVFRYQCENCGHPIHAEDGSVPSDGESLRDALRFQAERWISGERHLKFDRENAE